MTSNNRKETEMDNSANEIGSHSFDSKHVCQLIYWICTVPGVKDESQNFFVEFMLV